ncbi:Flagellar biosynthesis protein FlhF [hydrothermal vent metagenome]|uniref:Flagellar biosynthesis protein FlhF n=1 Tax=hydrothermal vent metagenome TaxID=652676 RepID=A0A3B1AXT5_9ZZZZ
MKINRFFAKDMRQAIRKVRQALGSDAVILSNKSVDGGVELVAAIDYDESAVMAAIDTTSVAQAEDTLPSTEVKTASGVVADFPSQSEQRLPTDNRKTKRPPRIEWSQDPILVEMRQEMHALRRMMENELSELTWRDMGSHMPHSQEMLRRLMNMDLSPDICRDLVAQVVDVDNLDMAWRRALYHLTDRLPVMGDDILEHGGAVAIVGPTGVGKTTTVAKLAARFCMRHGSRHVALITADNFRIGAREQLNTYARILDVPVRAASTAEELNSALNAFNDRRLILIDTAGMSQRDVRLSEQLSMLKAGSQPVRSFLALPATTQQAALEQAIKVFSKVRLEACIITKVDEAASMGGVLSAVIHSGLQVAFTTDGQKVPEDLQLARPHSLVSKAVALSRETAEGKDDDYLAIALGGARTHAHV